MTKQSQLSRRQFGKGLGAAALSGVFAPQALQAGPSIPAAGETSLTIPPLIDSRSHDGPVEIAIQRGTHAFVSGRLSETAGYNGGYLGPAIRMHQGEDTRIRFTNLLDEPTTVHGHGLHVPGHADGGPQARINPGEVWDVRAPDLFPFPAASPPPGRVAPPLTLNNRVPAPCSGNVMNHPKKSFADLPAPQQAGILCADQRFQDYAAQKSGFAAGMFSESAAAEYLRQHCIIDSRRELLTDTRAQKRLQVLRTEFDAWRGALATPRPGDRHA